MNVRNRFCAAHWLVMAAMAGSLAYEAVQFHVQPLPLNALSLLVKGAAGVAVCLGIGWARVLGIVLAAATIFSEAILLLYHYVVHANDGTLAPQLVTADLLPLSVPLAAGHVAVAVWTIWVLAFSENVRDFFLEQQIRN